MTAQTWSVVVFRPLSLSLLTRLQGNARILNDDTGDSLQQSLKLTNKQYSLALAVFYISYLLFDTPSTYLLKRYKPSRWFTLLMLLWSATTMSIAGVRNYHGLIVTRFLLGLFECGIFPGLVYCLTFWYKPDERALRVAIISTGAIIGGAFGGALAFGVGTINRAAGLQGWRWLFLIEGLPPIALAPFIFYFFPDYPETSHWLSPSERALATARIQGVGSLGHAKLTWADARNALLDGRLYLHHVMLISNAVPFSSISLFAPTIVRGLGFEGLRAQLFTVPPYAIALGVAMSTAWLADRYEARSLVSIAAYLACGVCFLIQGECAVCSCEYVAEACCGSHRSAPHDRVHCTIHAPLPRDPVRLLNGRSSGFLAHGKPAEHRGDDPHHPTERIDFEPRSDNR